MTESLERLVFRNQKIFLIAMAASIVTYGYQFFNFQLNIDGETKDSYGWTIMLGRWVHALLREHVLPEPFIPYVTLLIGLVFLSLSAAVVCECFNLKKLPAFAFAILFVSFPQLAYQFEFLNQADTFSIGYFLSTVAFLFFSLAIGKKSYKKYAYMLLSIVLMALAMAIYQSLIFVFISLFLYYMLRRTYHEYSIKDELVNSFLFLSVVILSYLSYSFSAQLVQHLVGVNSAGYSSRFFGSFNSLYDFIENAFFKWKASVIGSGGYGFGVYAITLPATAIIILQSIKESWKVLLLRSLIAVTLLISPFAIEATSPNSFPSRVLVAAPVVFAILAAHAIYVTRFNRTLLSIAIIVFIVNVGNITSLFHSDHLARNKDIMVANRIITIASLKYPNQVHEGMPTYFHGGLRNDETIKLPNSNVFGSSFFNWDGGNNKRITGFMRYYGIYNLSMIDKDNYLEIRDEVEALPTWPNSNSIKIINDILVVKLGNSVGKLQFVVD